MRSKLHKLICFFVSLKDIINNYAMESNYIRIYTGSLVIVQLLIQKLEEVGITPVIKDESESGRLAGFGAAIPLAQEVFVHEVGEIGLLVEDISSLGLRELE